MVAAGDENLGSLDKERSVTTVTGDRAACTDVGTGVVLGQAHRSAPALFNQAGHETILQRLVAELVDQVDDALGQSAKKRE